MVNMKKQMKNLIKKLNKAIEIYLNALLKPRKNFNFEGLESVIKKLKVKSK